MKRLMLLAVFASLLSARAVSGEPQQPGTHDQGLRPLFGTSATVGALESTTLSDDLTSAAGLRLEVATPVARAQQGRTPAQQPLTRRRRGSMVGYVDDATVESKVRLRFDSGFHITAPDRAEFFYAKCGCYSGLPADHPAHDPEAPGPLGGAASDLDSHQFVVEGEYAVVSSKISVFGVLPFRRIQPQAFFSNTGPGFDSQGGVGDIRAGVKFSLADTSSAAVTAKFQVYLPSGDPRKGLGTDHASFEPALLFHNSLSEIVEVESHVGVWLPIGGAAPVPTAADGDFAGRVFHYGIGPSFTVYDNAGVRFAPVVELVGWRVLSGNESVGLNASGTNIVNLKVGGRLTYNAGSIYVGYGHALTDKSWYENILRVEYRYTF